MDALRLALEPQTRRGRLSLIIFMTDGKPTVGETSAERISEAGERLRDGERIFAFGVGYDVNTYLLDRLAEGGRGAVSYVRPEDDVEAVVSSLTRKISFPALADLRVVRAPAQLEDFYPNPLPDLFYGEELLLFGRYRGHGSGELVLEGSRAGQKQRVSDRVELPGRASGNDFIPRLWAARKAGALTAQVRLHGPNPEVIEEIRQLGLRYGILTEYTSYLVEEPTLAMREPEAALNRARRIAAAPEEQAGEIAFMQAEASSRLQKADKLSEADAVVAGAIYRDEKGRDRGSATAIRQVGRRLFVLRDGSWTDLRHDTTLQVIEVAPFSEAYFELVSQLPALKPYFALGERVVIAGEGVAIELTAEGASRLSARQLRLLVRGFEGSL
jgi:Ca-activated chloride channel family protein